MASPLSVVAIENARYDEWTETIHALSPRRRRRWKGHSINRHGQKTLIVWRDNNFWKKDGRLVVPARAMMYVLDHHGGTVVMPQTESNLGLVAMLQQRDVSDESTDHFLTAVHRRERRQNHTGKHHRNHFVRVPKNIATPSSA